MKKTVLIIALLISPILAAGQDYTFSKQSASYARLTSATQLTKRLWFDFDTTVKMPFVFDYFNASVDSIHIGDEGIFFEKSGNDMIKAFQGYLMNRSFSTHVSHILSAVEGSAPNRIYKIEYRNVGFEDGDIPNDSANFQVWFYETSNNIEFHYGPAGFVSGSITDIEPAAGMRAITGTNHIYLEGDASSPTVNTSNFSTWAHLTSYPGNGTVYRFEANSNSIADKPQIPGLKLYPNPSENNVTLSAKDPISKIEVYDMNGRCIYQAEPASFSHEFSAESWSRGIYYVKVTSNKLVSTEKFIR